MKLDQAKLVAFANEYEAFQKKKKDLATDLKDYVDSFMEDNDIKKKRELVNATKMFLKFRENQAKFLEDYNTLDEFLDILTGVKTTEKISEEEARA